jgi:hypothetical protein
LLQGRREAAEHMREKMERSGWARDARGFWGAGLGFLSGSDGSDDGDAAEYSKLGTRFCANCSENRWRSPAKDGGTSIERT